MLKVGAPRRARAFLKVEGSTEGEGFSLRQRLRRRCELCKKAEALREKEAVYGKKQFP